MMKYLIGENKKIGIIGDAMIDEYFFVNVKKISPEFPIPVMHSKTDKSKICPGGAANVAHQFSHFSIEAKLLCFLDQESKLQLEEHNIDTSLCLMIENNIPRKRRFYSENFPTYRWDIEEEFYGMDSQSILELCQELYDKNLPRIGEFSALIFSDYDKGVCEHYLPSLIKNVPITVVDSKCKNIEKWNGCTVFKPNYKEAISISGCSNAIDAGIWIIKKINCEHVVITNEDKCITVISNQAEGIESVEIFPDCTAPQAESVIGAGDCFVAFLTMALVRGAPILEASKIALEAGLIYVRKKYNEPINKLDLVGKDKVVKASDLRRRDFKLVFTNGCFDLLHTGHIELLNFSKSKGEKLVVGINTDSSVSQLKKGRPIQSLCDRIKVLSSLESIDYIVIFDEKTPLNIIQEILPDVIVKGSEYKKEDIVGANHAAEVCVFPMVSGFSTTNLISQIVEKVKND